MPELTIRPGHPDFLDLPWDTSLADWRTRHAVDLPMGVARHEVRFLEYPHGLYVVKETSTRAAEREYEVLGILEAARVPAVRRVGLVRGRLLDPAVEPSAALITAYEPFSFSYRELLAGPGFGPRRTQMLDAFARLLVDLHLAGCFWGDCSLSNVLYRFDAEEIETIMVDAETAFVLDGGELSPGQRAEDLSVMVENVAGGMADIAAEAGLAVDAADLALGEAIADRYASLWAELTREDTIGPDERYRIQERIERLNRLGFDVAEVDVLPADAGASRLNLKVKVGSRTFHSNRLRELTGVDVLEFQARQILSDLYYFLASHDVATPTGKRIGAVQWRVSAFEPTLERLRTLPEVLDPVQAYCDLLHHRYVMSYAAGRDLGTAAAVEDWIARGRPGYPVEAPSNDSG